MRRDLPQSFRINYARKKEKKILQRFLRDFNGDVRMRTLAPDSRVWQVNKSRWELNIPQKGEYEKERSLTQNFIYHCNEIGHIARQELVSMVPVNLLDIQENHLVLDMCSSPGSKTRQALEIMQAETQNIIPKGVVIANEFSPARCFKMIHNIKKTAAANVITVNHDGRTFPDIFLTEDNDQRVQVQYDRIICDQPCSGDGTVRKNPNVWLNWSPQSGNARHTLQYDIARRGLELLKVGGLFAYSSCAMNPIENEAVLLRLLKESNGAFEIVDKSRELSELGMRCKPGFTHWKVFRDGDLNEVTKEEKGFYGMFPDSKGFEDHLVRCMRFLPHLNNDGGFFVAILKKIRPMPWEKVPEERRKELRQQTFFQPSEEVAELNGKSVKQLWRSKESFDFAKKGLESVVKDLKFYGIKTSNEHLSFFKSGKKVRLTNKIAENILQTNFNPHFNVTSVGIECFQTEKRNSSSATYSIARGSAALTLTLMNDKRAITLPSCDIETLLDCENFVTFDSLSSASCEKLRHAADKIGPGCIKLAFNDPCHGQNFAVLAYLGEKSIKLELSESQKFFLSMVLPKRV